MATSSADSENAVPVIVLTGGPGGGKSALLNRCMTEPELAAHLLPLEEAIQGMRGSGLDPRSREFHCVLAAHQIAAEDALKRTTASHHRRAIVTHGGTLDRCAFWQSFGYSRESFFEMTGSTLEVHYRRYSLVLHLESAAVRVPEAYLRYPLAPRAESAAEATRLDELLASLWSSHPRYVRMAAAPEFEIKLAQALRMIRDFVVQAPSPHSE